MKTLILFLFIHSNRIWTVTFACFRGLYLGLSVSIFRILILFSSTGSIQFCLRSIQFCLRCSFQKASLHNLLDGSQWYLVSRDWNCHVSSLAVKCIAKDSKCSKDWPCAVSENGVTGMARRRTSMMLWNMKMARVVGTGLADPAMWVDIQTAPLLDSKLP